jgi:hypothetical protein
VLYKYSDWRTDVSVCDLFDEFWKKVDGFGKEEF